MHVILCNTIRFVNFVTEGVLENRPGVQKRRGRRDYVTRQLDHVYQSASELFAARRLSVLL